MSVDNEEIYNYLWGEGIPLNYKEISPGNRWFECLLANILKMVSCTVETILDIGCGDGSFTAFMNQKFPNAKTKGIDFSKSGIESAKSKFKGVENLSFDCVDVNDTGIWSQNYDIVTAFEVLEHIEDYQSVLTNMINASDKYIILSFPTGRMRKYEHKIGHVRNFKYKEVESFISHNFDDVIPIRIYYAGFPFYSPISRELINYMYGFYNSEILNARRSFWKICYEQIFFILFKYFSTKKRWGDQFMGIFEKR